MEWRARLKVRERVNQGVTPVVAGMHRVLQRRFPEALWIGQPTGRQIALTFDDGPSPRDTLPLLDVLARHQVRATFFNIGERVRRHPDLARAVAQAGHHHASHGFYHRAFPLVAAPVLRHQLDAARDTIAEATGRDPSRIRYVRPPFGWFTPATLTQLDEWGYRPTMWTVVPIHWLQPSRQTLTDVVRDMTPGAILVLHESLGGPPVARLTDQILTRLKDMDYEFVTVDALWRTRETASPEEG